MEPLGHQRVGNILVTWAMNACRIQWCDLFADIVHVRICPLSGQLVHAFIVTTTDLCDHITKPMAYHNSERMYEPRLEPVTIVSKCYIV